MTEQVKARDPRKVFVVHGRDQKARRGMFEFLRSIGLDPIEWSQAVLLTKKTNPYVGEILDAAFAEAGAIVVLMTRDDEARLRRPFLQGDDAPHEKELCPQSRPNVLFEAGMAMGRCAERTILVELGKLRPFSDIGGRHVIRLDNTPAKRQELARRLEGAGCPVNLSGADWYTTGDFSTAEEPASPGRTGTSVDSDSEAEALTEDEIAYLVMIATGPNEGRVVKSFADGHPRRETERYRTMLEKFVDLGLMRDDDPHYWFVTSKGYDAVGELKGDGLGQATD